ncbi:hypothetical protein F2Q68_00008659 [Brassica cretica]|uniref:Uncharacterized protein n=1 Tax=Brassica cretica TaxID=69181 RepID=A0A8S9L1I4_BRACR|nr:hypothetical protein F2Q68_00008659 [Brassica cretica]
MLHKIRLEVATSHLRDFGSARIAFYGFNQIGREEYFYRSADLFNLNDWIDEANALRTFRLRFYQAGNLEAIYIRGMYEFFVLHLLDEGREKIRLAGALQENSKDTERKNRRNFVGITLFRRHTDETSPRK